MEKNIVIEELTEFTPEVAEAIRKLVVQLDEHFEELTDEDLQGILASKTTHLFVAKVEGNIVGMTTLVTYRIPYKHKAWMEDVVVDSQYRGKGIGSKLIREILVFAKQKGFNAVDLTSNPRREEANQLYQRLGFEKRETNVYRVKLS